MNIKELCEQSHATAKEKGWWKETDTEEKIPEKIALMHSELSEALEFYREPPPGFDFNEIAYCSEDGIWFSDNDSEQGHKPEGMGIEMADCVIRIADLCQRFGIDLEECLRIKTEYNKSRSFRHGGKTC